MMVSVSNYDLFCVEKIRKLAPKLAENNPLKLNSNHNARGVSNFCCWGVLTLKCWRRQALS